MPPPTSSKHQLLRRSAFLFTALILIAPLIGSRDVIYSQLRAATMCAAALGFFMSASSNPDFPPKRFLRSLFHLPTLPAIALLLWATARYFQSTPPSGPPRNMALAELLRLSCGILIFLSASRSISTTRQIREIFLTILIFAFLDSIAGILTVKPALHQAASAAYFNKQLLAAFLVGLVPFSFVTLFAGPTAIIRRTALPTLILLISALLLTGNRTSWIGAAVGLVAAAPFAFHHTSLPSKQNPLFIPLTALAILLAGISIYGAQGLIRQRFDSDSYKTFTYRFPLWRAAINMIRHHPALGIGIGQYPLHASAADDFTHAIPNMQSVLRTGPTLWCIAHNEYLQTAAEIGLIALGFYLAILISFLFRAVRSWLRMRPSPRRALLAAATCAVIAQCIDALANPAWRFIDVNPILWLMLALGVAAIPRRRFGALKIKPTPPENPTYRPADSQDALLTAPADLYSM
jgi:O-antigen ligase